jgi:hypothetical protein
VEGGRQVVDEIGDDPDPTVFKRKAVFDYWRRKAARNALPPPAPARQANAGDADNPRAV